MDYDQLYSDIVAAGFDLMVRDDGAIAAALSVGRTKTVHTEIGNGMVLATLGLASGNALLDAIYNTPDFRYVKPLLEQGRLDISTPLASGALDGLAGAGVITQDEANAIKALAIVPDPVSVQDVAKALEGK